MATKTASLRATKAAAKAPSKAKVTKAPAAPQVAPAAPLPVVMHGGFPTDKLPKHLAVRGEKTGALRGTMAQAVLVIGKEYKMRTDHTQTWAHVALKMAAGKGGTTGAALCAAGVPAHMVSYMVRREWLAAKA